MIKKASELRRSLEPNLKGGKDTVRLIHFLEQENALGTGRLFGISIIPPNGSIGYHQHSGDFETYYILKGSAKVVDNGVEGRLMPGDAMLCGDGDFHSIENDGEIDLEYVAVILYSWQQQQ